MGVNIPPEFPPWLADWTVGHIPEADVDAMRRCGDAWSDSADFLRALRDEQLAGLQADDTIRGYTGETLSERYSRLDQDIGKLAESCDDRARQQYESALAYELMQYQAVFIAGVLLTQVATALLMPPPGGLVQLTAAKARSKTAMLAARDTLRKKLLELAAKYGDKYGTFVAAHPLSAMATSGAVFGVAAGGGVNWAAQRLQVEQGDRDSVDTKQVWVATAAGAVGGITGAVAGGAVMGPASRLAANSALRAIRAYPQVMGVLAASATGGVVGSLTGGGVALLLDGGQLRGTDLLAMLQVGFGSGLVGATGAAIRIARSVDPTAPGVGSDSVVSADPPRPVPDGSAGRSDESGLAPGTDSARQARLAEDGRAARSPGLGAEQMAERFTIDREIGSATADPTAHNLIRNTDGGAPDTGRHAPNRTEHDRVAGADSPRQLEESGAVQHSVQRSGPASPPYSPNAVSPTNRSPWGNGAAGHGGGSGHGGSAHAADGVRSTRTGTVPGTSAAPDTPPPRIDVAESPVTVRSADEVRVTPETHGDLPPKGDSGAARPGHPPPDGAAHSTPDDGPVPPRQDHDEAAASAADAESTVQPAPHEGAAEGDPTASTGDPDGSPRSARDRAAEVLADFHANSGEGVAEHLRLGNLSDEALRAKLFDSDSDQSMLATMEVIRRGTVSDAVPDGMVLRVEQLEGVYALAERPVEMKPGEGKSLMFLAAAMQRAVQHDSVLLVTTTDGLAHREFVKYRNLLTDYGIDVFRADQQQGFGPITDRPAIVVATGETVGHLTNAGHLPPRRALIDEIDGIIDRGERQFLRSEGADRTAPESTAREVFAAHDFLADARAEGRLSHEDFGLRQLTEEVGVHPDGTPEVEFWYDGQASLTPEGRAKVEALPDGRRWLDGMGLSRLEMAAAAEFTTRNKTHYVMDEGKIVIIDQGEHGLQRNPTTSSESRWSAEEGAASLAQAIEAKEVRAAEARGLSSEQHRIEIRADADSTTRIDSVEIYRSGGRFFDEVTGASGTLADLNPVLEKIYGLESAHQLDRSQPQRLVEGEPEVVANTRAKLSSIAESAYGIWDGGRGRFQEILVHRNDLVDRQVDALVREGVPREAIEAVDADRIAGWGADWEAQLQKIFDDAGEPGKILVINRQGQRGVDIAVSEEVLAKGGMHVWRTEVSEQSYIAEQGKNRTARNGAPGTTQAVMSPQDALIRNAMHLRGVREAVIHYEQATAAHRADPTADNRHAIVEASHHLNSMVPDLQQRALRHATADFLRNHAHSTDNPARVLSEAETGVHRARTDDGRSDGVARLAGLLGISTSVIVGAFAVLERNDVEHPFRELLEQAGIPSAAAEALQQQVAATAPAATMPNSSRTAEQAPQHLNSRRDRLAVELGVPIADIVGAEGRNTLGAAATEARNGLATSLGYPLSSVTPAIARDIVGEAVERHVTTTHRDSRPDLEGPTAPATADPAAVNRSAHSPVVDDIVARAARYLATSALFDLVQQISSDQSEESRNPATPDSPQRAEPSRPALPPRTNIFDEVDPLDPHFPQQHRGTGAARPPLPAGAVFHHHNDEHGNPEHPHDARLWDAPRRQAAEPTGRTEHREIIVRHHPARPGERDAPARAATEAWDWLARQLSGWPAARIDDAGLTLADVVEHSVRTTGDDVRVVLAISGTPGARRLRIAVHDRGQHRPPDSVLEDSSHGRLDVRLADGDPDWSRELSFRVLETPALPRWLTDVLASVRHVPLSADGEPAIAVRFRNFARLAEVLAPLRSVTAPLHVSQDSADQQLRHIGRRNHSRLHAGRTDVEPAYIVVGSDGESTELSIYPFWDQDFRDGMRHLDRTGRGDGIVPLTDFVHAIIDRRGRSFASDEEARAFGEEHSPESRDHRRLADLYITEGAAINRYLRGEPDWRRSTRKIRTSDEMDSLVTEIDALMLPLAESIWITRKVDPAAVRALNDLQVGDRWRQSAYLTGTTGPEAPYFLAHLPGTLRLLVPRGTPAWFIANGGKPEIVVGRGRDVVVRKVESDGGTVHITGDIAAPPTATVSGEPKGSMPGHGVAARTAAEDVRAAAARTRWATQEEDSVRIADRRLADVAAERDAVPTDARVQAAATGLLGTVDIGKLESAGNTVGAELIRAGNDADQVDPYDTVESSKAFDHYRKLQFMQTQLDDLIALVQRPDQVVPRAYLAWLIEYLDAATAWLAEWTGLEGTARTHTPQGTDGTTASVHASDDESIDQPPQLRTPTDRPDTDGVSGTLIVREVKGMRGAHKDSVAGLITRIGADGGPNSLVLHAVEARGPSHLELRVDLGTPFVVQFDVDGVAVRVRIVYRIHDDGRVHVSIAHRDPDVGHPGFAKARGMIDAALLSRFPAQTIHISENFEAKADHLERTLEPTVRPGREIGPGDATATPSRATARDGGNLADRQDGRRSHSPSLTPWSARSPAALPADTEPSAVPSPVTPWTAHRATDRTRDEPETGPNAVETELMRYAGFGYIGDRPDETPGEPTGAEFFQSPHQFEWERGWLTANSARLGALGALTLAALEAEALLELPDTRQGSLLIRQERPRLPGEIQPIWKLRTLSSDDPNRPSVIGRAARTLSLDELPQCAYIAIVGARPLLTPDIDLTIRELVPTERSRFLRVPRDGVYTLHYPGCRSHRNPSPDYLRTRRYADILLPDIISGTFCTYLMDEVVAPFQRREAHKLRDSYAGRELSAEDRVGLWFATTVTSMLDAPPDSAPRLLQRALDIGTSAEDRALRRFTALVAELLAGHDDFGNYLRHRALSETQAYMRDVRAAVGRRHSEGAAEQVPFLRALLRTS
ncbi:hypothetical protein NMK54_35430 [Nocardia otitidiscaviarum]|nr:hypothetical protein [Nocardia otitidiscaviarum]MCP9625437.1 hypothetical protein [Nocardia otitidiscaviarum]